MLSKTRRIDCHEILNTEVDGLSDLKNQTVVITGGTGFIGSWLIEMIIALNEDYGFNINVYIISTQKSDTSYALKLFSDKENINFIQKDIRNLLELPRETTYIIHAAANPDNRIHISNPIETMSIISDGTKRVLEVASECPNLKKVINLSSGNIYGKLSKYVNEKDMGFLDCGSILSVYPESKRFAETLSTSYQSLFKLPIVTVRPFSFIGPYMSLNKPWAINNFIRDAMLSNRIKILGDGQTVRSYMYPSDMAHWLLRFLVSGKPGKAYNLGSSYGITLEQLANEIVKIMNKNINIDILNMSQSDSIFVPDTKLAEETLSLTLKVPIDFALKRTIEWNMNKSD